MLSLIKSIAATSVALTVVIAGTPRSLESAIELHHKSLRAFVESKMREDRTAVDDILQCVAITVTKKARKETLRSFRSDEEFRGFLFVTAKNKILHARRARAHARETDRLRPELEVSIRHRVTLDDMELCEVILEGLPVRYADALRAEFLGADAGPSPAYVRSRALAAAQEYARNRGLNLLC